MKDIIKKRRTISRKRKKSATDLSEAIEIVQMWQDLAEKIEETHPKNVSRTVKAFQKNVMVHYEQCIENSTYSEENTSRNNNTGDNL